MMPMARAMVTAVLLVAVGADLLSYHSYIWQAIKSPWRVVARWRTARGIQREIDAMDRAQVIHILPAIEAADFTHCLDADDERAYQIAQALKPYETERGRAMRERLELVMSKTERIH